MSTDPFAAVDLFVFDIDGTLTDATTSWLGPAIGWTQTYSVRDGEALIRLVRAGVPAAPLSRNKTECARVRMEALGVRLDWLGVSDKIEALGAIVHAFGVPRNRVCFVGDGIEDAAVFAKVGLGCAVADAHPKALAAAAHVTRARGGARAIEELVDQILTAKGLLP